MPTVTYSAALSGAGLSMSASAPRTADGADCRQKTIGLAQPAVLTTRTSGTAGTLTMTNSLHGITTGMKVDLYFAGGIAYDVTVGTVSGTSVPFTGAVGTALPIATSAIAVAPQVPINFTIDGDNLTIIGVLFAFPSLTSTDQGHIDFQDSGPASVTAQTFVANTPRIWDITGGDTNSFTGNVIQTMLVSNGSTTASATVTVIYGVNA